MLSKSLILFEVLMGRLHSFMPMFINGLHLYSASNQWPCKVPTQYYTQHSPIHAHIHTPKAVSTMQAFTHNCTYGLFFYSYLADIDNDTLLTLDGNPIWVKYAQLMTHYPHIQMIRDSWLTR